MPYFNYYSHVWMGQFPASVYQVNFKSFKIGLPELSPLATHEVSSSDLLDELGWGRLETRRLKQLAIIMYKIHNNRSPLHFRRMFTSISTLHTYNLRHSDSNCFIPRPRTGLAKITYTTRDLFCGKKSTHNSDSRPI